MKTFLQILAKLTEFRKRNMARPATLRLSADTWNALVDELPAGSIQFENRLPGAGPKFQGMNVVFGGAGVEVSA